MIQNSKKTIPVLVSGALGRMGREVVKAVLNSPNCELVAALDKNQKNIGENISELLTLKSCDVFISTLCLYPQQEILCGLLSGPA